MAQTMNITNQEQSLLDKRASDLTVDELSQVIEIKKKLDSMKSKIKEERSEMIINLLSSFNELPADKDEIEKLENYINFHKQNFM